MAYDYFGWKPYVPVATRRRQAEKRAAKLAKKGRVMSPVVIDGRTFARTFWGEAWCENLERYSDFANRLPRGRTYVRNGSVVDLQIAPGLVSALVSGSDMYEVTINVSGVPAANWRAVCKNCAGAIDSVVELLQGKLSQRVMAHVCEPKTGLFPAPKDITFVCTCPDWASMCKHVAAVLYGIGARLDAQPEPLNLLTLKAELSRRWPMTSLLDMLKETDFRIGFTDRYLPAVSSTKSISVSNAAGSISADSTGVSVVPTSV